MALYGQNEHCHYYQQYNMNQLYIDEHAGTAVPEARAAARVAADQRAVTEIEDASLKTFPNNLSYLRKKCDSPHDSDSVRALALNAYYAHRRFAIDGNHKYALRSGDGKALASCVE